jgi:hypothetical protein
MRGGTDRMRVGGGFANSTGGVVTMCLKWCTYIGMHHMLSCREIIDECLDVLLRMYVNFIIS